MKSSVVASTSIGLAVVFLTTGCETQQGAQFVANLMPKVTISGPGGPRTFGVPASAFYSDKLNFQTAVVKGDAATAGRYIKPDWATAPIKGYPPIYYAAATGSTALVQLLVRNGASVRGSFGNHSLAYVAASYGHSAAAREISALGGGSDSDVSRGQALYAENQAIQHRQAAALFAGALIFLDAAMRSSSHSSGGRDEFGNTQHDYDVMSLHDAAHASGNTGSVYY